MVVILLAPKFWDPLLEWVSSEMLKNKNLWDFKEGGKKISKLG